MATSTRLAGLAAILLASACCPTRALPVMREVTAVSLPVERYRLDNGLEVILHEDHRSPVVSVNLWYHVGAKDEPPHRNGFAHLFEHLMFQGSRHVGQGQYFSLLARAGVTERNGLTSDDRTEYFETLPADRLDVALFLESDRMGTLVERLDQANFEREREVVKNERRQNYENAPYGLVRLFVRQALYPEGHPYHRLAIGTPEDLDAATLDDVKAFWQTFYRPDNATLVIAGDIDRAAARGFVQARFGPIASRPAPPAGPAPPPVRLERERRVVVEAGMELAEIVMAWPAPPAFAPGDAELELARGIVQRSLSRLVGEVIQSVGVQHQRGQLGGQFEITLMLRPGASIETALAAADNQLEIVKARPPVAREFMGARAEGQARLLFLLEHATGRAQQLNLYGQLAADPGFVNRDIELRRAVTTESLHKALATYLPADRRVVALVRPNRAAPRCGRLVEGR